MPTPNSTRPLVTRSSVASCLASRIVSRSGMTITPSRKRIVRVTFASDAQVTRGS